MAQTREIKKRIVAVGTIQRITKTMQMIATAKFTAASQRARATRPYTRTIRRLVGELAAAAGELEHPLIDGPPEPVRRELLLAISSDRGLCGAYNANVLRAAIGHIRDLRTAGTELDLETSGKKAISFFRFQQVDIDQRHLIGDSPDYREVEALASRYIDAFAAGRYDAVRVAYMRFESNARQVPEVLELLPIEPEEAAEAAGEEHHPHANYEFSPSREALLADLLPMAVKAQLFQAFNDAVVSEQLMRMVAMKAATENAKDLGRMLNRQFNRARQAQITTELSEIIGGTAALE
ncbi:MAG: ATP synthase F1 subunit gamma [Planctomycetota bacterium]|nr:ATP synthase F1 subunit gamma [Planctomycetota bacterium]